MISQRVLQKGLDAGTAFEILSIDIADVDVGRNIGAELQTDQAEADLKIAKAKGEPGVAPTVGNAVSGSYPITRPLQIYTLGDPEGVIKDYLDWIMSTEGQKVVQELGYVPIAIIDG